MQIDSYLEHFSHYLASEEIRQQLADAKTLIADSSQVFFIGNGGSNAISQHMAEDYTLHGGIRSYCFSDPSTVTCLSNDFGYENAMRKWLELYMNAEDTLVAISSSGQSKNILNAVSFARERGSRVITLSGFRADNPLRQSGDINLHIEVSDFGVVECLHHSLLHVLLDSLHE
jgi:D-sedoheptulose 7-phosphate isomerase